MRDTIYRDDAIRVASGFCHPANVARELAKLPSAQPERKKGRWIDEGLYADFFPHHAFCCSECGHHLLEIEVVYDYCPFCGAKMEAEHD